MRQGAVSTAPGASARVRYGLHRIVVQRASARSKGRNR
jgi:hypothetical protein